MTMTVSKLHIDPNVQSRCKVCRCFLPTFGGKYDEIVCNGCDTVYAWE